MNWSDEAIVLGGRLFGEGHLILDVLTASQGRRSGLVYGGASRRRRAQYQPGNSLSLSWAGRLDTQLGRFEMAETTRERSSHLLDRPLALSALASLAALLRAALDEGDAEGSAIYPASVIALDALHDEDVWPALYARWELGLLTTLGFGLDLERCAVSGANDGLTHVSPRTGKAVRGSQVPEFVGRLLPLPAFLTDPAAPAPPEEILCALELTGHFLETRVFFALNKPFPEPRRQLIARLRRQASTV